MRRLANGPAQRAGLQSRIASAAVWLIVIPLVGCSGGTMLHKDQKAPSLSSRADGTIQTIDGRALTLDGLGKRGPVVLVLLRGFS